MCGGLTEFTYGSLASLYGIGVECLIYKTSQHSKQHVADSVFSRLFFSSALAVARFHSCSIDETIYMCSVNLGRFDIIQSLEFIVEMRILTEMKIENLC